MIITLHHAQPWNWRALTVFINAFEWNLTPKPLYQLHHANRASYLRLCVLGSSIGKSPSFPAIMSPKLSKCSTYFFQTKASIATINYFMKKGELKQSSSDTSIDWSN
jgi:hypothetical protein